FGDTAYPRDRHTRGPWSDRVGTVDACAEDGHGANGSGPGDRRPGSSRAYAYLVQPFVWREPTRPLDPSARQYRVGCGGCSGMLYARPKSDEGGSVGGAPA